MFLSRQPTVPCGKCCAVCAVTLTICEFRCTKSSAFHIISTSFSMPLDSSTVPLLLQSILYNSEWQSLVLPAGALGGRCLHSKASKSNIRPFCKNGLKQTKVCKGWILSFTLSTLTTSTPSAQGSWILHLALSHVENAKETTNTAESHAFDFQIFGTLLNTVTKRPSPSLVQSGQRSIFVDGKCFYFKSLELFMVRGCQYNVNAYCVLYVKGLQILHPNRASREENPCHCQCPEHDMRFCLGSVDV